MGNVAAKGKNISYVYYRCTCSDAYRFGGNRVCSNKQVRFDLLEQAVWEDVQHLHSAFNKVRRGISRIIDSYQDGLLEKQEFESRSRKAKEGLKKLETELQDQ